jgi:hypothetical protein
MPGLRPYTSLSWWAFRADALGKTGETGVKGRMKENDTNGALVFVYNADSGLFNAMADAAHKIFSPATYACNLCALTHSTFGMRKDWKRFLETLGRPIEFLHADELKKLNGISEIALPAVFSKVGDGLNLLVDVQAINRCRTMEDLEGLIEKRLAAVGPTGIKAE